MVYNSQLFKEAGVKSTPKNWKEFRDVCKKLTKATKPGGPVDQWGWPSSLRRPVLISGFPLS